MCGPPARRGADPVAATAGGVRPARHPVTVSLVGGALSAEAVAGARSLFVGREGEEVAGRVVTLVDDPRSRSRSAPRATTPKACRRVGSAHRRCAWPRSCTTCTPRVWAAGAPRAPRCAGVQVAAGRRPSVVPRARQRTAEEILASLRDGLYVQSVSGLHSGTNPVSGDFSVGADGLMVRNGVFAEPVREVTIASTLQRMLHDIVHVGGRPHVAPRWRRGHDPARRRHVGQRRLTPARFGAPTACMSWRAGRQKQLLVSGCRWRR